MDSEEAAEYLRLEKRLVTEWARKGYIPAHPLGEGRRKIWRFLEHELVDWLDSQTNGTR
jgi:excisionase family DNA binding protein